MLLIVYFEADYSRKVLKIGVKHKSWNLTAKVNDVEIDASDEYSNMNLLT